MLPLINVAVLLLVLLAVGARLDPPDPLDVALPQAEGQAQDSGTRLFLAADGTLALGNLRGEAVFAALVPGFASGLASGLALDLHADRAVPLETLLGVLDRLGSAQTRLVVLP